MACVVLEQSTMRRHLGIAVCALFVTACSPEKEIWQTYGADAVRARQQLEKLQLVPLPQLEKDGFSYSGPPLRHISQNGTVLVLLDGKLAHLEDGAWMDPHLPYAIFANIGYEDLLRNPLRWAALGRIDPADIPKRDDAKEVVSERIGGLARARYVLLIKTLEHRRPELGNGGFVPGSYRGEAHLVSMDGKHLGGVRFWSEGDTEVSVQNSAMLKVGDQLNTNLVLRALQVLDYKLHKKLDGMRLPYGLDGYDEAKLVIAPPL